MRRIACLLLIVAFFIPFAAAWDLTDNTKFVTVWSGATPIKDSLSLKSASQRVSILKTATDTVMSKVSYPYEVSTTLKIIKYRCDTKTQICGYWVEAYRGGKTVATNSPIWINPPPIVAFISEVYNPTTDTLTTTIKEDPKLSVEQILQMYVDNQPLGKPVIGTKE